MSNSFLLNKTETNLNRMLCFDCTIYYYLFNISGQHKHNRELSHISIICWLKTLSCEHTHTHPNTEDLSLVYSVYQFVFKSNQQTYKELQLFPIFN